MHLYSLLLPLLAPLAIASPLPAAVPEPLLLPRDPASIVSSIQNIESKISALNNTLNGLKPYQIITAVPRILKVMSQTNDLSKAVESATSTVSSTPHLDDAGSLTVAQEAINLEPQIASLLNNIVSRKKAFDTAILGIGSVSKTVDESLKKQKDQSAALGKALVDCLNGIFALGAAQQNDKIAADFDAAITAYNAPGGIISLPPIPSIGGKKY